MFCYIRDLKEFMLCFCCATEWCLCIELHVKVLLNLIKFIKKNVQGKNWTIASLLLYSMSFQESQNSFEDWDHKHTALYNDSTIEEKEL